MGTSANNNSNNNNNLNLDLTSQFPQPAINSSVKNSGIGAKRKTKGAGRLYNNENEGNNDFNTCTNDEMVGDRDKALYRSNPSVSGSPKDGSSNYNNMNSARSGDSLNPHWLD